MKKTHLAHEKTPVPRAGMRGNEKRRLLTLSLGAVLVVAAIVMARFKAAEYARQEEGALPVEEEPAIAHVEVPRIDVDALERTISDGTPEDRVVLEQAAVDELLGIARNLGPAHFAAMGARELDAALVEELLADPSSARGQAFTARGWIESLRERRLGKGRPNEYHGRLVLEDDVLVYFIADRLDGVGERDYARVDGLLLKAFNDEDRERTGEWIQGPLLVAPEAVPSYAALGVVKEIPFGTFVDVADDDASRGISELPVRPLWTLLAFARDAEPGAVDWEAAPELDGPSASAMLSDGDGWRGRPFRLPVSKLMGVRVRRSGENPARMEHVTEGWIGNGNWTGEAKVLRFAMPGAHPELAIGDLVTGRGFFLKNHAYEPGGGGLRLASMVVLDSLEVFVPPEAARAKNIWVMTVAIVGGLGCLLFVLVLRDRRQAQRVEQSLLRRRRERRATHGALASPPPPSGD